MTLSTTSAARTSPAPFVLPRAAANDEEYARLPFARRYHPFLLALNGIRAGSMDLELPGGVALRYDGPDAGARAHLRFHDWKCLDRLVSHGDLGWGEDYALGLWETEDLAALMDFVGENADALEAFSNGNTFFRLASRLKRRLFANSPRRSRRNVHRHYDLGNDFYAAWLDDSMTYSCALFGGDPALSLGQAQKAKYRRILDRLAVGPGDEVLEIGCGWGGFMREAARRGARVTGLTLSTEQAEFARARLAAENLEHACVRLQDYRRMTEQHDKIASIGMFEHVGEKYWGTYMRCLHRCLRSGGRAMVQTIVIRDDLFDFYHSSTGFIREHIFPGGMLPTRRRFEQEAARAGLRVEDVFHFGRDYAITLGKWLERFDAGAHRLKDRGYCDNFMRKWRFYLTYCAAMFRAGRTDVMQVQLAKD